MGAQVTQFAYLGVLVLFGIGVVWALAKLSSKTGGNKTLAAAIVFLDTFKEAIVGAIGKDWEDVYTCLLQALKAVADGKVTEAEAKAEAKEVFDVALAHTKVTLTAEQIEFAHNILDKAVLYVVHDTEAMATALSLRM